MAITEKTVDKIVTAYNEKTNLEETPDCFLFINEYTKFEQARILLYYAHILIESGIQDIPIERRNWRGDEANSNIREAIYLIDSK